MNKFIFQSLLFLWFCLGTAHATELLNAEVIRQKLGLGSYPVYSQTRPLKIAILDNGFNGFAADGVILPRSAQLIPGPQNDFAPTNHGLGMAQIVWALTGKTAAGPDFRLINSDGFTNFKAAIDYVIQNKIDIVLYSQVWPFGGNFDGTGLINAQVDRAVAAGVIWVNAAGNYGKMVYGQKVLSAVGKNIRFQNKWDENSVTVTLSWNDFSSNENVSTQQDLDLLIYDADGTLVGSSELIQRGEAPGTGKDPKLSSFPREVVTFKNLRRGKYRIVVRQQSQNFDDRDLLRIVIKSDKPDGVDFTDHTTGGEIMAPADHEDVITVGDQSEISSVGPTSDGRMKPEVLLEPAVAQFSNGSQYGGSSVAAAFFASITVLMKQNWPTLTSEQIQNYALAGRRVQLPIGFSPVDVNTMDPAYRRLVPANAQVGRHPVGRYVVFTQTDPLDFDWFFGARQQCGADTDFYILAELPYENRWGCFYPSQDQNIRHPWMEFRKGRFTSGTWKTPYPSFGW